MSRATPALFLCAGLMGMAGVAAGAVAAHGSFGPQLQTASTFLLLHAAPVLAIGLSGQGRRSWLLSGALLTVGTVLFSGQLALGAVTGARLFPLAAPVGGWIMIAGWLAVAVSAFNGRNTAL